MIFYFSGTGNSEWVARQIAQKTNDCAYSIVELETIPTITKNDTVGFVFPVYAWAPSQIMTDFAKKIVINGAFSFAVATCAVEVGLSLQIFGEIIPLQSTYSLCMPNNYIIGSDVDLPAVVQEKIKNAVMQIEEITQEITAKKPTERVCIGKTAFLKSTIMSPLFNAFARTTKPFFVTEQCNSCARCEKQCPAKTIHLVNGKPTWSAKCYQCLSCINRCPQKAIEYGKSTKNRSRYFFEQY